MNIILFLLFMVGIWFGWANYELKQKVKELEEALEKERQEKNPEN